MLSIFSIPDIMSKWCIRILEINNMKEKFKCTIRLDDIHKMYLQNSGMKLYFVKNLAIAKFQVLNLQVDPFSESPLEFIDSVSFSFSDFESTTLESSTVVFLSHFPLRKHSSAAFSPSLGFVSHGFQNLRIKGCIKRWNKKRINGMIKQETQPAILYHRMLSIDWQYP